MSEERLKRIEVLLETAAKMTVQHQKDIERLDEQMIQLTLQMANLSQIVAETMPIIRTMQSDIKGLQTENKRILDHLFGESEN
jgi:thymidylate synthase